MKKEIDFGYLENADMEQIEHISENIPPVRERDKKNILEMSIRKYDKRKNDIIAADFSDDDTVSGSEPYRRRHSLWRYIGTAAACLAVIGSLAGGAVLLRRHKGAESQFTEVSEPVTEAPENTAFEVPTPKRAQEIVFRKGEDEDGEILLTGDNVLSAEVIRPSEESNYDYEVVVNIDSEGQKTMCDDSIFPVSVWIDGKHVSRRNCTSYYNGQFCLPCGVVEERANEIAYLINSYRPDYDISDAPLYDGCIADCLYEFEKKYDGSLATGDYTVYDVNGDSIPELFIIYTLGDGGKHYELYFFNGERYEIGCASDDYLTVNSGAHDGLVFTQTPWNSQNYKVYYVSQGRVKLIYDMNKEYNDDGSVALTINGNEVSEAKWQEMTDSISTENMKYPDELSKVFAGFGR